MILWTEQRLHTVLSALPAPPPPAANYVPVRSAADFLYVAGQTPHLDGALSLRGRVGENVSIKNAHRLAADAALNALAAIQAHLGDLTRLHSIVSLTGYVAAAPTFTRHPAVIDGASNALGELLGKGGRHARAAVGVASLPDGAPVEISVIAYAPERPSRMRSSA